MWHIGRAPKKGDPRYNELKIELKASYDYLKALDQKLIDAGHGDEIMRSEQEAFLKNQRALSDRGKLIKGEKDIMHGVIPLHLSVGE